MNVDLKAIGKRIWQIRGNESQESFGARIGVSKSMVSMYERGEAFPKPEVLARIVEASGRTFDWLYRGEDMRLIDEAPEYGDLTEGQRKILEILDEAPEAKEMVEKFYRLPRSKQLIRLGEIVGDLEDIDKEGK